MRFQTASGAMDVGRGAEPMDLGGVAWPRAQPTDGCVAPGSTSVASPHARSPTEGLGMPTLQPAPSKEHAGCGIWPARALPFWPSPGEDAAAVPYLATRNESAKA
jgi:hypothetical protein